MAETDTKVEIAGGQAAPHSPVAEWFAAREADAARLWGRLRHPRTQAGPMAHGEGASAWAGAWLPDVDIFERGDDVVVSIALPGVNKEDLSLTLDRGNLVIRGERKFESEVREQDYYWMERSYGSFYRVLPVPEEITADQVAARLQDGELQIRLPKVAFPQSTPRRIPIQ